MIPILDPAVSQALAFAAAGLLLVFGAQFFVRLASFGVFAVSSGLAFLLLQRFWPEQQAYLGVLSVLAGLLLASMVRHPLVARWGAVAVNWLLILLVRQVWVDAGMISPDTGNWLTAALGGLAVLSPAASVGVLAGALLVIALRLPLDAGWQPWILLGGAVIVAWARFGRLPAQAVSLRPAALLRSISQSSAEPEAPIPLALSFATGFELRWFERHAARHGWPFQRLEGIGCALVTLPAARAFALQRLNHLTGLFHTGWPSLADRADAPLGLAPLPVSACSPGSGLSLEEVRRRLRAGSDGNALPDHLHNGAGAQVAILDTGVEPRPEYGARLGGKRSFVPGESVDDISSCKHGSNCGMIVNAIAPEATLHFYKVLGGRHGSGQLDWILQAYNHVLAEKIDVINCSYGACSCRGASTCLSCRAVERLRDQGVTVCAAAGNSGPGRSTIDCPGGSAGAIAVASADRAGRISFFSSRGPSLSAANAKPDVTAYGEHILLRCRPSGPNLEPLSGTSFSCPQVAGLAAVLVPMVRAKGTDSVQQEVRRLILECASPADLAPGAGADPNAAGRGLVNIARAVRACGAGEDVPDRGRLPWPFGWSWLTHRATLPAAACLTLLAVRGTFVDSAAALSQPQNVGRAQSTVTLLGRVLPSDQPGWTFIDDGTGTLPVFWSHGHLKPRPGAVVLLRGKLITEDQSVESCDSIVLATTSQSTLQH